MSQSKSQKWRYDPECAIPNGNIVWSNSNNTVLSFVGGNTGTNITVKGNAKGETKLTANLKGFIGKQPEFNVKVTDLEETDAWVFIVGDGSKYAATPSHVTNVFNATNQRVSQFGTKLRIAGIIYTNNPAWFDIADSNVAHTNMGTVAIPTNSLRVFFVDKIDGGDTLGFNGDYSMAVSATTDIAKLATILAHEVGHACGLNDIYPWYEDIGNGIPFTDIFDAGVVRKDRMEDEKDWGAGYYQHDLLHTNLLTRLLMHGYYHENMNHVPHGSVYGIHYEWVRIGTTWVKQVHKSNAKIGLNSITRRRPEHLTHP